MESEFVPRELWVRASAVGFNEPWEDATTIEELERWIWEKHRDWFPKYHPTSVNGYDYDVYVNNAFIGEFPDPFSARLAGVTRVIEELEKGVKDGRF